MSSASDRDDVRSEDPRERTCRSCGGTGCEDCDGSGAVPLYGSDDMSDQPLGPRCRWCRSPRVVREDWNLWRCQDCGGGSTNAEVAPVSERLREIANEMNHAADLEERDRDRPVTRFDARRWADEIRATSDITALPREDRP